MYESIKNFFSQFLYLPKVENGDRLESYDHYVVAGMGGSHWAANIIKGWLPHLSLQIHSDYGLPYIGDKKKTLIIASSYSGTTEETLDAFNKAKEAGIPLAAIATGRTLLEYARQAALPYVILPTTGIEPRMALGYSMMAMLKLMKLEEVSMEAAKLAKFQAEQFEDTGRELSALLKGYIPLIYTSAQNRAIGQIYKIKLNESAKIPAFCHVIPEMNHHDMNGFDAKEGTKNLSKQFFALFLKSPDDHSRNIKRMDVTASLFAKRGIPAKIIELQGANWLERTFKALVTADWMSYYIAQGYGVNPEGVPMVEEFKKLIA